MSIALRQGRWSSVVLSCLLTACVTINVYFPAAAAEKAADRIINEVLGNRAAAPAAPPPATPPQSRLDSDRVHVVLMALLDCLVSPAQAQADINVSTPGIAKIKAGMTARNGQLEAFYNSGVVGFAADGSVAVRDLNAVPLKDRARVNKLVADENRDRSQLYREIAKANNHPEWEADIRATFARQWAKNARAGWWVQEGGGWRQR